MASHMTPPAGAEDFLAAAGWAGADIRPLAGDASFRRYFRVADDAQRRNAVLMDAPPPHEDPRPYLAVADYLRHHGFHAPEIFARNVEAGLVLLEDMGDRRMREHLDARPDDERRVYTAAIDELVRLHASPCAALRPYDMAEYLREAGLLTLWYAPAAGLAVDADGYMARWRDLLAPVLAAQQPPVTVLRDYHAENVMLLDGGTLGLLDFQDALAGHRAYDLVSLLQDARRDVDPVLEAAMLDHYLAAAGLGAAKEAGFRRDYAILGAQRNAKIIGIFTRLWKRDGKPRYLSFLPRMWGLIERDLAHPALAPMRDWFDANIPAAVRLMPLGNRT